MPKKKYAVRKITGVYDHAGHIKLTPEAEAHLLIFPKKTCQDLDLLAEHPAFEHEIDGSGYLEDDGPPNLAWRPSVLDAIQNEACSDAAPHDPEKPNEDVLDDSYAAIALQDTAALLNRLRYASVETIKTICGKNCDCRNGTCVLKDGIEICSGHPLIEQMEFLHHPVPTECEPCVKSFCR